MAPGRASGRLLSSRAQIQFLLTLENAVYRVCSAWTSPSFSAPFRRASQACSWVLRPSVSVFNRCHPSHNLSDRLSIYDLSPVPAGAHHVSSAPPPCPTYLAVV